MAFNEAILADQRPNFFELLAEEQLREALRPALLYLVKVTHRHNVCTSLELAWFAVFFLCLHLLQVVARSNPDLFSGLWRSRDEIHLILDSALQGIFLTLNGYHPSPQDFHFSFPVQAAHFQSISTA